jgi:hypothetical protein
MPLISSSRARELLRAYPFKAGQSELKRVLRRLFGEPIDPIDVMPGLRLVRDGFSRNARIFWWFEEVEAPLQYFLTHYLPFEGRMIDCGAASGLMGLLAARRRNCQAVFIEADRQVARQLNDTVAANERLAGLCTVLERACALESDRRFMDVQTVTLERVIDDMGWQQVDLLKIDVDGPDYDVLRSAGRHLRPEVVRAVFIELPPTHLEGFTMLQALGYRPFAARKTHLPALRRKWLSLCESDCFAALAGPVRGPTKCENVLWLAPDLPATRHLEKWCPRFDDVRE